MISLTLSCEKISIFALFLFKLKINNEKNHIFYLDDLMLFVGKST